MNINMFRMPPHRGVGAWGRTRVDCGITGDPSPDSTVAMPFADAPAGETQKSAHSLNRTATVHTDSAHGGAMRIHLFLSGVVLSAVAACTTTQSAGNPSGNGPLISAELPVLAGQAATCAGPREKSFTLEARETTVDLGMSVRFTAWTYNGKLPGPTLEACEGDHVKIALANHANTSHGLDSHALRTDMTHFGPVAPDRTLTIEKTVDTPGAFMYHCASGPVTDLHIKSGLHGAMIVYPRNQALRPARELVVVEDAVFGDRDATGLIPGANPVRVQKNDPSFMMFNGRLEHAALAVSPGDLIRTYFVNIGPGVSAVHVIAT